VATAGSKPAFLTRFAILSRGGAGIHRRDLDGKGGLARGGPAGRRAGGQRVGRPGSGADGIRTRRLTRGGVTACGRFGQLGRVRPARLPACPPPPAARPPCPACPPAVSSATPAHRCRSRRADCGARRRSRPGSPSASQRQAERAPDRTSSSTRLGQLELAVGRTPRLRARLQLDRALSWKASTLSCEPTRRYQLAQLRARLLDRRCDSESRRIVLPLAG